jgi:hypothetical protein
MIFRGPATAVRRALIAAWLVLMPAVVLAGNVRLTWDANTEPDLTGYVLVWGNAPGVYLQSASVGAATVSHEVTGIADGIWYFAIRAVNTTGFQSAPSNEVMVTVGTPTPIVSSFSPAAGPFTGGTQVTILGSNFEAGAIVRFGSVAGTMVSVSPNRIVVKAPAQPIGTVSLTVLNPSGKGLQLPSAFRYQTTAPTITSVSPVSGPAAGGTEVTVVGTGFESGVSVSVSGVAGTVLSVAPTSLKVRLPAHAPGAVGLTVTNVDSQSAVKANAFTYVDSGPAITHVLPEYGSESGGTQVTVVGSGFSASAVVEFAGVPATVVSRSAGVLTVLTPAHAAGPVVVEVDNGGGVTATRSDGYTYQSDDQPFVRYFAEGASGAFFQTRFALANPHTEPMPVTVTFTDTLGTATTMEVVVPARARITIDESNRPALASDAFATKFECAKVIGVERTMTWAAGGPTYGAHSETGASAPRTSWMLAEGATIGGFNTFYLLQNPTTEAAQVKVQYLLATGERIEKVHPVAPLSRTNIWVNKDDPALAAAEMSATITSLNNVPVVVERSMYRNTGPELFSAGHNSAAVEAPAMRWFLAEGATGGTFDEFVLIANPNAAPATLKVSYLRAGQAPIVQMHTAAAFSRLTLWVDQAAPELANAEVSVVVESLTPTPIVVERSMWWRASPAGEWVEAHNSRGATATAARWLVADGEAGGAGQASTYVLVANTSGTAQSVRFTLLPEAGASRTVTDTVSANGRFSLDVAAAFPGLAGTRFSVLVESTGGSAPLVVERASYSSTPTTPWASGTNALAMPLP